MLRMSYSDHFVSSVQPAGCPSIKTFERQQQQSHLGDLS